MWYEALPTMVIIGVCMYSYQIGSTLFSKLMFGQPYRRSLNNIWERNMFERDNRVAGAAWKTPTLDNIPDEK